MSMQNTEAHDSAKQIEQTGDLPRVLRPRDVAEITGLHVKTVRAAIEKGQLPARRIGNSILIDRNAFLKWLADGDSAEERARKGR